MITLSPKARDHFIAKIASRPDGWGILLGVRTTGCSGMAYVLEFWDGKQCNGDATDHVPHMVDGIPFVIRRGNEVYFDGLHIDYVRDGVNEGIEFTNPNETSRCGCGESFSV